MQVTFNDGTTEEYEDESFASGKEGEVFRSRDGRSVVKLYYSNQAEDAKRIRRINTLIKDLNPAKDAYWREFFSWPEKRVRYPAIGFSMRFVSGLRTLDNYIYRGAYRRLQPEERGWFIGRIATAIKLVSAAHRLSSMGLCYPDFSHRNIMVDPFVGSMVIIDCDSLAAPPRLEPTMEGTGWYRAPEIVTRSVTIPSVITDRHAFAVLLYIWLLTWHPLLGDKVFDPADPDRDDELRYGTQALYIEHPTNMSNQAKKQMLKAHHLGPELEQMFKRSFIDGLHQPDKRPMAYEWQSALNRTYDRIIPCASPACDWHSFVAAPPIHPSTSVLLTCPRCNAPLASPKTLPFVYLHKHRGGTGPLDNHFIDMSNAHYVVGWHNRMLYRWHCEPDIPAGREDLKPRAVFEYDHDTQQWYLKNMALPNIQFLYPNSTTWLSCPPSSAILLVHDMEIQLGKSSDYFRAHVKIEKVA